MSAVAYTAVQYASRRLTIVAKDRIVAVVVERLRGLLSLLFVFGFVTAVDNACFGRESRGRPIRCIRGRHLAGGAHHRGHD